jgi:ATP-dependent DNA helicase RecQ
MFHSKTSYHIKEKIRKDMSVDGNIRVLICTNSAGMGVNFHNLHNIVHYGLPREMDTLVQQMGRAGRDGEFSHELILYKCHKGHLKLVEDDLVQMVKDSKCRRGILCTAYASEMKATSVKHNCCDICEKSCSCGDEDCPASHPAFKENAQDSESEEESLKRSLTPDDRNLVKCRLQALKFKLSEVSTIVTSELTHGFNDDTLNEIMQNLEILFTPDDVMKYVAIWSYDLASQIADLINDALGESYMYDDIGELGDLSDSDSDID